MDLHSSSPNERLRMCHKLYTYTLTECANTYMAAASYFSNAVLIDGDFSSVRSQLRLRLGVCSFFFSHRLSTQTWKWMKNKCGKAFIIKYRRLKPTRKQSMSNSKLFAKQLTFYIHCKHDRHIYPYTYGCKYVYVHDSRSQQMFSSHLNMCKATYTYNYREHFITLYQTMTHYFNTHAHTYIQMYIKTWVSIYLYGNIKSYILIYVYAYTKWAFFVPVLVWNQR